MFRKLKSYAHRLQTRRELEQLSDKELRDIGISRSDIPAILRSIN